MAEHFRIQLKINTYTTADCEFGSYAKLYTFLSLKTSKEERRDWRCSNTLASPSPWSTGVSAREMLLTALPLSPSREGRLDRADGSVKDHVRHESWWYTSMNISEGNRKIYYQSQSQQEHSIIQDVSISRSSVPCRTYALCTTDEDLLIETSCISEYFLLWSTPVIPTAISNETMQQCVPLQQWVSEAKTQPQWSPLAVTHACSLPIDPKERYDFHLGSEWWVCSVLPTPHPRQRSCFPLG